MRPQVLHQGLPPALPGPGQAALRWVPSPGSRGQTTGRSPWGPAGVGGRRREELLGSEGPTRLGLGWEDEEGLGLGLDSALQRDDGLRRAQSGRVTSGGKPRGPHPETEAEKLEKKSNVFDCKTETETLCVAQDDAAGPAGRRQRGSRRACWFSQTALRAFAGGCQKDPRKIGVLATLGLAAPPSPESSRGGRAPGAAGPSGLGGGACSPPSAPQASEHQL